MGCVQSASLNKPKKIDSQYIKVEVEANENHSELSSKVALIQNYKRSDMYVNKKVLGTGAYSIVNLVVAVLNPRMRFAVKSMPKTDNGKNVKSSILNEIYTLRTMDHPGVIYCNEVFEGATHIDAIIELCDGPTLEHYISTVNLGLSTEKVLIMYQLSKVAAYLKSQNMIHRDFKTANVLLHDNKDKSELAENDRANEGLLFDPMVQVIDFGFIKDSNKDDSLCGSPKYMAPETFKQVSSFGTDLWALGIIFYNLISGEYPFNGEDRMELYESITIEVLEFNPDSVWKNVPAELTRLITRMLEKNPKKRISIEEVVNHKLFEEINELSRKTKLHQAEIDALERFAQLNPIESAIASYATRFVDNNIKNPLREKFILLDKENTGKVDLKISLKNDKHFGVETGSITHTSGSTLTNEKPSGADGNKLKSKDYSFTYSNYVAALVEPDMLFSDEIIKAMFESLIVSDNEGISGEELLISPIFTNEKNLVKSDLAKL